MLWILVLSFLFLTIVEKEVSLANSFSLDFNSFGKSLMWTKKRNVPSIEPWETSVKPDLHDGVYLFKMTFEIFLKDSFQEGYKALQRYP